MNINKIKYFLPPILLDFLRLIKKQSKIKTLIDDPKKQSLDLYYDPQMAKILDTWGERNAWIEIQHIFHENIATTNYFYHLTKHIILYH